MSKLEELIRELCPEGVEYLPLEKCCEIWDRKRKPVTKSAREAGQYPYYGANGIQDYVSDYIFDGIFVLVGEDGSVITDVGTPIVTWAEGKIWVNNHAHIISEKEGVMLRFLFHFIQTVDVTALIHGNIPKLTGADFRAIKIPIPPIEIQQEIVRILDRFDTLCNDISRGLPAEIAARRKQYEYYRDKLLNFNEQVAGSNEQFTMPPAIARLVRELCPEGVEYKTLGVLGVFYGGLTGKFKDDFKDGNAKFITYNSLVELIS